MAQEFLSYAGTTRSFEETGNCQDFVFFNNLDDDTVLAVIADGTGDRKLPFQAHMLCTTRINRFLERFFAENRKLVEDHTRIFMEQAFIAANDVLGGFKCADTERYDRMAASVSAVLIRRDGTLTFAHSGNTRIWYMKDLASASEPLQLTVDQTEGWRMVERGVISEEEYYMAPERLNLTGGIGPYANPDIQTFQFRIRQNDVILMTTDGVHYCIRPEGYRQILSMDGVNTPQDFTVKVLEIAQDQEVMRDDRAISFIWYKGSWYEGD